MVPIFGVESPAPTTSTVLAHGPSAAILGPAADDTFGPNIDSVWLLN